MQVETRLVGSLAAAVLPLASRGRIASHLRMIRDRSELVLFDAAGTLIGLREPVEIVYRDGFARHGWQADPKEIRRGFLHAFGTLGDPDFAMFPDGDAAERAWWREVVARTAESTGIDSADPAFGRCFQELFEHYASGAAWWVFPEVPEVLAALKSRGCKLAVVSNFDRRLHRILADLGLAAAFDLILTSADVAARKPDPGLLLRAMEAFPGCRARLVGDSPRADGGAAAAAGVPVFLLDRPELDLWDFANRPDREDS